MKWMIIRQKDERSSDICAEIERRANQEGGLKIPFTIQGTTYGKEVLNKALNSSGDYYTHLFHEHCRSHLVPLGNENGLTNPARGIDDLDVKMLTAGSLSYNADLQTEAEGEFPEGSLRTFKANRINLQTKQTLSKYRG